MGELNAILWVTHHIWADLSDREPEYIGIRCDLYGNVGAKRIERIRTDPISNPKSRQSIINRWKKIDAKMGLNARAEQYEQFLDSQNSQD